MDGELRRAKQTDVKACARLRYSPPHIPRAARLAQVLPGQQEPTPDRPHRDIEHHAATLRALSDPSANAREADKRAPAVLGEFQGLLDRVERIVGGDVMLYSGLRSLADLLKPHNRSGKRCPSPAPQFRKGSASARRGAVRGSSALSPSNCAAGVMVQPWIATETITTTKTTSNRTCPALTSASNGIMVR
jgi:hypothetical protein